MAASTTVRVTPETRERLARLANSRGISTPDLIERLVERAEGDELLATMNEHYEALQADPDAWAEYRSEVQLWDPTVGDGLE